MIDIREVQSRPDMKKFVNFPLKLYKGDPNYAPCFYADELNLFGEKNIFADFSESKFFLAYKDGKVAGRLGVIINHAYNKKTSKTNARFTRFDVIDDIEVSRALFAVGESYARDCGMNVIHGPLGYMDIDKEGMLVEGYEWPENYGGTYNFPYYNDHMGALGFEKEVDWLERRITIPKTPDKRMMEVAQLVKQRYKLRDVVSNDDKIGDIIDRYGVDIFKLVDAAYAPLHGTVPITPRVRDSIISQLKLILSPKYITIIADEHGELVGFGAVLPSMSKALNKSGGKLFPTGAVRLLLATLWFKEVEFGLIAIHPKWQRLGVSSLVAERIMLNLIDSGVQYAETNAMLENNHTIHNMWSTFDSIQHKRRRCYVKKL